MIAYQLKLSTPAAVLGIVCDEAFIYAAHYLPPGTRPLPPQNLLARECQRQVHAYLKKPRHHRFDLPLLPAKTPYQQRVRAVVQTLRGGQTLTYGDVARRLGNSSPRAVGGACRANDVPLLVPCHRVVAANGLGGFMGSNGRHCLNIKMQLLRMEGIE